ncbi:hypothetical protein [Blastococcus sp. LR1]|uniref:hypothetical protein n=1 Tax=Blastococcus sp. LR1 TaxID=2877000 RepID=UPI001CCEE9B6|nr:hypothetical protein [Blastococcus sp. LR1]MCA0144464.1 hypothetical protein [Blastococcus sp. LR1]
MTDALLVGNNLAVLVAAAELGEAGRDVVLVTDGRPAGGHFRGRTVSGTTFDVGMVVLERSPGSGPAPDPAGYRPERRYDWTRFGTLVDDWLDAHAGLRCSPTPEALVEGRRRPDHLLADRLDVLAELDVPPPAPLSRNDPAHAAAKTTGAAYDTLTYAEAARLNHGPQLHGRLVEPFADKVLGPLAGELLARYHRAAWLPLYWPETLAAACAGEAAGLPEHRFWTTEGGAVAEVVAALESRVARLPNVHVSAAAVESLAAGPAGWQVRTADGTVVSHARPVLGLGHDRVQHLLGLPVTARVPGAAVVVVCCLVRGAAMTAPSPSLAVLDPALATYRITDQDLMAGRDPEWHRVVVEAGSRLPGEDLGPRLVSELCELLGVDPVTEGEGLRDVRVLATMTSANGIAVPTAAALAADEDARAALAEACPEALPTGVLAGVGVSSLSDQVVQGLAVAAQLR